MSQVCREGTNLAEEALPALQRQARGCMLVSLSLALTRGMSLKMLMQDPSPLFSCVWMACREPDQCYLQMHVDGLGCLEKVARFVVYFHRRLRAWWTDSEMQP